MKSFFQIVFGTLFALILFTVVVVLLCIGIVVGLARLGSKQEPRIEPGSYLVVDLSVNLTDTPPPSEESQFLSKLFGGGDTAAVSLRSLLDSINLAGRDSRIAGIFLSGSFEPQEYGSGFAALKEVREALAAFHATSKKPVVAYLVAPSTRDYYLASAADTIYLNPYGEMEIPGMATEPMFLKGALDKYGIGVQVTRVGKYKSAVEPLITDRMSPENREQTQKLLDDVWSQFKEGVAQSRGTTPDALQALVDKTGIINAADAKANNLITDTAYLPDVIDSLRRQAGTDQAADTHTFKQVSLSTYIKQKVAKPEPADTLMNSAGMGSRGPRVAIVYAEGEIVDGDSEANGSVAGDRFARELRHLRQDAGVKAILLRVNSPGGSGLASEVIQRELVLARQAGKTVVVSMGTVAASGGYYISTAADRVFAEPNTITGSIGVFGILPNIKKLANDNGVTFDEVKTGKYAALSTASRPKTTEELQVIQSFVDDFYGKFIHRVAEGRNLKPEAVQEIAQGRVWSGEEAIKIGLVDEIGGLEKALAFTKSKASLPVDAKVVEYPAPKELAEQLAQMFSGEKRPLAESQFAQTLHLETGGKHGPLTKPLRQVEDQLRLLGHLNDPNGTYARLPFDLELN